MRVTLGDDEGGRSHGAAGPEAPAPAAPPGARLVAGRQARDLRPLDDRLGPGLRPGRHGLQLAAAVGAAATPIPSSPYVEWYENSLRFPDSPAARHHRATYGDRPYRVLREPTGRPGSSSGTPKPGRRRFASSRRPLRRARRQARTTATASGRPTSPTRTRPGWHCAPRRRRRAGRGRPGRGPALRPLLLRRPRLDLQGPPGRVDVATSWPPIPRGDYPRLRRRPGPRADRPLPAERAVERHRLAGAEAGTSGRCSTTTTAQVPDGVVNDRWLPWSPLFGRQRTSVSAGGRSTPSSSARSNRDGGLVPPAPPHFDVRTPEYVVFDDVQRDPLGVRARHGRELRLQRLSRPEDFIAQGDLLWLLTDIVAKGGNLLLNVGPAGFDAQIPDEQAARLGWLGDWVDRPPRGDRGDAPLGQARAGRRRPAGPLHGGR